MKVTKLVHSCLIIEKDGRKALVDPGSYSWESGIVDQSELTNIDYVLVTHAHPDHIDLNFINVVHELSPNAVWFVTESTQEVLKELPGATIKIDSSLSDVRFIESEHADLTYWGSCKDHTSFVLFDDVLVSGDCHTLTSMYGASIFAGAVNGGPWGSVKTFLNMIADMNEKPAKVLPLHDWHWNDQARSTMYTGLSEALDNFGVEFVPLKNGTTESL